MRLFGLIYDDALEVTALIMTLFGSTKCSFNASALKKYERKCQLSEIVSSFIYLTHATNVKKMSKFLTPSLIASSIHPNFFLMMIKNLDLL
jgi:hypothetical protein